MLAVFDKGQASLLMPQASHSDTVLHQGVQGAGQDTVNTYSLMPYELEALSSTLILMVSVASYCKSLYWMLSLASACPAANDTLCGTV